MNEFWRGVFGNDRPTEIEIGPGTGTFLLAIARAQPDVNFVGIEHSTSRAARLTAAAGRSDLANVRVIAANAACVIATLVPEASVAAYHIYFPDPWWKRRHRRRRLFTPEFAATIARTLVPAGRVFVATDVEDVHTLAVTTLDTVMTRDESIRSPRMGETAFERKGKARGARIFESAYWNSAEIARCALASEATRETLSPLPLQSTP